MAEKLSQAICPEDITEYLYLPNKSRLVDVVEYLREQNVYVEVFLSDSSTIHTSKENEYTIRVSDGSGGNVSRYSTKSYKDCLVDGLRIALRICF